MMGASAKSELTGMTMPVVVLFGPAAWLLLEDAAALPTASTWLAAVPWTNCPFRSQGGLCTFGSRRGAVTQIDCSGKAGTRGGRLAAATDHCSAFRLGKAELSWATERLAMGR